VDPVDTTVDIALGRKVTLRPAHMLRLGRGRTSNLCPRCAPKAHGAAAPQPGQFQAHSGSNGPNPAGLLRGPEHSLVSDARRQSRPSRTPQPLGPPWGCAGDSRCCHAQEKNMAKLTDTQLIVLSKARPGTTGCPFQRPDRPSIAIRTSSSTRRIRTSRSRLFHIWPDLASTVTHLILPSRSSTRKP
jgi:hypothetical protein